MDIETTLADVMYRELTREYITTYHETVDETRFEEAIIAGKGNWVDAGILYDMLEIARNMK